MGSARPILFIILVAYGILLHAQQYSFRNFSVKEGVAQSQVFSLLQDHRGYLWMGTRGGGLTRYDGVSFRTYTTRDGLCNNYVYCTKEDANHNLWIGTNNGLAFYNGVNFKTYKTGGDSLPLSVTDIAIAADSSKWLATNYGIMRLVGDSLIAVSALLNERRNLVNTVCISKQGKVWYGTRQGLSAISFTGGSYVLEKYYTRRFVSNPVNKLCIDALGRMWIGTYDDGVFIHAGDSFYRFDKVAALDEQSVFDIYFDSQDNVWFATLQAGALRYNLRNNSQEWLNEDVGLTNNHVRSIVEDRNGNYWFGTSGGGVSNYYSRQFTTYDKSSGLAGNFIYSLLRDSKKRLWIGNSMKGFTLMQGDSFIQYNANHGFIDTKVKAIGEDKDSFIYLGTEGNGLYRFDGTIFTTIAGFTGKYIRAIVRDQAGNLFVATAGSGIFKITFVNKRTYIKNLTIGQGLLSNRISCLLLDGANRLWYGTEGNGVGVIINNKVTAYRFGIKSGLPSNAIRSLAADNNGHLWVGTAGSGLAAIDMHDEKFNVIRFNKPGALTSGNIYLLIVDRHNNLYVGTETGVDRVLLDAAGKALNIRHYGRGDGFTGIETCQNSVIHDPDGVTWFGTINGLIKFTPASQQRITGREPVTSITDVKLFYEPIAKTAYRSAVGDWNSIHNLVLPHDQNHLTFDFNGINFSNPDAVMYQWKLEGFDRDWSPPSQTHTVTYSNIAHGNFTFMVRARNEDGIWNKEPAQISFSITPPFWLRWWVIVLFTLTLAVIIMLAFKYRVDLVRKKALEQQQKLQLEKEVVELQQKALRLQMNPHFIFNALNSIQSQIGTDNEQAARYYLAKFSRLMRQILDNSRNTSITLQEEINTLENYLLIEKFCNGDRFDYEITVDKHIETDYTSTPPMLLQPFIENAIKHGLRFMNDKRGMIKVKISEHNGILACSVADNGIGRKRSAELNQTSKETYHRSTALLVTQERLELLKIDSDIKSLEIIDLYDEHGEACGTQVVIRIPLIA